MARRRGVEVFSTFCESQASGVPFHVVARLFRDGMGIIDLDEGAARGQVRSQFADAGEEDVLLRCDLLGIRDPEVTMPKIDPDAAAQVDGVDQLGVAGAPRAGYVHHRRRALDR